MNTIPQKPHDSDEAFEFSRSATEQLSDLVRRGEEELVGRILAQIRRHISEWSPGDEDGEVVKHVAKLSRACGWAVYRLKFKPQIQQWRVFFFMLNGRKPPKRRIEEIVEYVNQDQCYDDMKQPHLTRIRSAVLTLVARGDVKTRKR